MSLTSPAEKKRKAIDNSFSLKMETDENTRPKQVISKQQMEVKQKVEKKDEEILEESSGKYYPAVFSFFFSNNVKSTFE